MTDDGMFSYFPHKKDAEGRSTEITSFAEVDQWREEPKNQLLELRKQELKQYTNLTFSDFHSIVSKSMPDVTRFPDMYNLCYDLMELAWETSQQQVKR